MSNEEENVKKMLIIPVILKSNINGTIEPISIMVTLDNEGRPDSGNYYTVTLYKEKDFYIAYCKQLNIRVKGSSEEQVLEYMSKQIFNYLTYFGSTQIFN